MQNRRQVAEQGKAEWTSRPITENCIHRGVHHSDIPQYLAPDREYHHRLKLADSPECPSGLASKSPRYVFVDFPKNII